VTHVTSLHHVGDRPNGILDRHGRVEPRRPVDVDVVGAEPAQRIAEEVLHRERPRIVAQPIAADIAQRTELDADDDAVAITAGKRFADQHLVVTHAVEIAGVEEVDAGIESGVNRGDALAAVSRPVHVRHSHAAKPDGRDLGPRGAEPSMVHD
jgi:hypothetical protein